MNVRDRMEGVSSYVQTLLEASSVPVLWDILWLKMVYLARVRYKNYITDNKSLLWFENQLTIYVFSKCFLLFSTTPHYLHNTPYNVDTDVNQCMDKNGGCEQLCVDLPGAYRCSCFDGYLLAENNFNCTGTLYVTHISINALMLLVMNLAF